MNILFDRGTMLATGFDRPALPFEIEIKNITDVGSLTKQVPSSMPVSKVDSNGNILYALSEPVTHTDIIRSVIETTEITNSPVFVEQSSRVPLLDNKGAQVTYTPYEGAAPILCYITKIVTVQKRDDQCRDIYYKDVETTVDTVDNTVYVEITKDDPRWTTDLPEIPIVTTRTALFTDEWNVFTYEDVAYHKQSQLLHGTLYLRAKLFERPNTVISGVDIGVDYVSLKPGDQATAIVDLGIPASDIKVGIESNVDGLNILVGADADHLVPVDKYGEAYVGPATALVSVRFMNTTAKRIDVYSFNILY